MTRRPETSRDPVCGMVVNVAASPYSTMWQGLEFHFCSAQCQERFIATPALYTVPGGVRNSVPIVKRRKLHFVAPTQEALRAVCGRLLGMMGVAAAIPGPDDITVEYDLRQATFAQVEAVVAGASLVSRGGLHRWRRSLWKFIESNEIENEAHPASGACCNRPPARLG
ncbi:MAG: YHS domain-containing protein [Sulfuritalea sp.]|nr:YHS domain-containing protein [Sulfuritalea sp.]